MHEIWTDQLSDYLDGHMSAADRETLEAHLQTCAECRQVLAELNEVATTAGRLEPRAPTADLWPGIAGRIRAETDVIPLRSRRTTWWTPQAVAAGIGLLLIGASGGVWLGGLTPTTTPVAVTPVPAAPTAQTVATGARTTDAAIAELEAIVQREGGRLDSTTVRIVSENLAIINRALADAQRALAADSTNPYVRRHLASATRRKLELLRRAAELATAQS